MSSNPGTSDRHSCIQKEADATLIYWSILAMVCTSVDRRSESRNKFAYDASTSAPHTEVECRPVPAVQDYDADRRRSGGRRGHRGRRTSPKLRPPDAAASATASSAAAAATESHHLQRGGCLKRGANI